MPHNPMGLACQRDSFTFYFTNNFTKRRMSRKMLKFGSPIRKTPSLISSSQTDKGKQNKPVCNDVAFITPHNNSKQTVPEAIYSTFSDRGNLAAV
jgi:hypothetical protein